MKFLFIFSILLSQLTSFAALYSAGEPAFIWEKQEIKVCWQDDRKSINQPFLIGQLEMLSSLPMPFIKLAAAKKESIRKIITQEYTKESTGIHFVGWRVCDETTDWDLAIFISAQENALSGKALIGQGGAKETRQKEIDLKGRRSFVFLNSVQSPEIKVTSDEYLQMVALHEFGHVAGLRHEQIRSESMRDKSCELNENYFSETEGYLTKYYGAYDPSSIMNYCFVFMITKSTGLMFENDRIFSHHRDPKIIKRENGMIKVKIGLSRGDVSTLQCLYFPQEKLSKNQCLPN